MTKTEGKMRKLQRLQIYVIIVLLSVLLIWIAIPHTRSQPIIPETLVKSQQRRQFPKREALPIPDQSEVEWLLSIFKVADTTADGQLSVNELTWAIQKSVTKHIQNAMRSNPRTFFRLDRINHNGQVEWTEWLTHFQKEHNIVDIADFSTLQRGLKEQLAAAKAAWSEAARTNPDALNIDEYLSFTHPESSHSALAQLIEELLGRHDDDDDSKISLNEYLDDPVIEFTAEELADRKRRFLAMDSNNDGLAERRELLVFHDPKHVAQAKEEAIRLMSMSDVDKDELIDKNELVNAANLFLNSMWVSPERTFHWNL